MKPINTRINYLYRDADNYKMQNSCVIEGPVTEQQIGKILSCCDMAHYFIPKQVGLPETRFKTYNPEVDHCWFEIEESGFEPTDSPPDVALNAEQLIERFDSCAGYWDDGLDGLWHSHENDDSFPKLQF